MDGDLRPLLAMVCQEQANAVAAQFGMGPGRMGEAFRLVRFGDLEGFFQAMTEPIPGAEQSARRERLEVSRAESRVDENLRDRVLPDGPNERIHLMGHHHLCAGAFEELFALPAFRAAL